MALRIHHITVDCAEALRVATFWSAALGIPLDDGGGPEFASIAGAESGRGWLFFQVPEPKTAKNRMHFDLRAPGPLRAEVRRLEDLGAMVSKDGTDLVVMTDPEGNEFCVEQ